MGLNCSRYCINQVESVCIECNHHEAPKHGDEWIIEDEAADHKALMSNGLTYCNNCNTLTSIDQIHGGKCDNCWYEQYIIAEVNQYVCWYCGYTHCDCEVLANEADQAGLETSEHLEQT